MDLFETRDFDFEDFVDFVAFFCEVYIHIFSKRGSKKLDRISLDLSWGARCVFCIILFCTATRLAPLTNDGCGGHKKKLRTCDLPSSSNF